VALLGIQPADTTMGAPLSQTAQTAVHAVAQALAELLRR
jgi:Ni,Fe-hydrogenase maturation factor